jgi:hypothetical protein
MLQNKERRALLWSAAALVGAVFMGHEALAGNASAPVPGPFAFFSVVMTGGQQMTVGGSSQIMIDDITYAPTLFSTAGWCNAATVYVPVAGSIPAIDSYYEATGTRSGTMVWANNGAANQATTNGGSTFGYDSETWSFYSQYACDTVLLELPVGMPAVPFDESVSVFHSSLRARQTIVDPSDTSRTMALGLGISESLSTLSESRHYQTPHIAQGTSIIQVWSPTAMAAPATPMTVYIKGRANLGMPLPVVIPNVE